MTDSVTNNPETVAAISAPDEVSNDTHEAWFIALPRSPLVFRNGMPFGEFDGAGGGEGYSLPRPSTMAGGARAAWADAVGYFDVPRPARDHERLKEGLSVHGPFLAKVDGKNRVSPLVPAPADAIRYRSEGARPQLRWRRLSPLLSDGNAAGNDLPWNLRAVMDDNLPDDAQDDAPGYWGWDAMMGWLLDNSRNVSEAALGTSNGLTPAVRTHQARDAGSRTTTEGSLHQSLGLDGEPANWHEVEWDLLDRLAIVVRLSGSLKEGPVTSVDGTVRRLGADGRSVRYRSVVASSTLPPDLHRWRLPQTEPEPGVMPRLLRDRLHSLRCGNWFRLVLATPAVFNGTWHPDWLEHRPDSGYLEGRLCDDGPRVRLRAAASPRWRPVAGIAMATGALQPVRRMIDAGSVYWLELLEDPHGCVPDRWMTPVVSRRQDRSDGWGLALLGTVDEQVSGSAANSGEVGT